MNRKTFLTLLGVGTIGMTLPPNAFSMPVEPLSFDGMTEDPTQTPEAPRIESYEAMEASLPIVHGRHHPRYRWTFPIGVYSTFQCVSHEIQKNSQVPITPIMGTSAYLSLVRGVVARMWYAYKNDPVVREKWDDYASKLRRGEFASPPYALVRLDSQAWEEDIHTLYAIRVALVETDHKGVDPKRSSLYLQTMAIPHDQPNYTLLKVIPQWNPNPDGEIGISRYRFARLHMSGVKFLSFDADEELQDDLPYQDFSNLGWIGDQLGEMSEARLEWSKQRPPHAVWSNPATTPLVPEFLIESTLTIPR